MLSLLGWLGNAPGKDPAAKPAQRGLVSDHLAAIHHY